LGRDGTTYYNCATTRYCSRKWSLTWKGHITEAVASDATTSKVSGMCPPGQIVATQPSRFGSRWVERCVCSAFHWARSLQKAYDFGPGSFPRGKRWRSRSLNHRQGRFHGEEMIISARAMMKAFGTTRCQLNSSGIGSAQGNLAG
jgi:hypothetical protein